MAGPLSSLRARTCIRRHPPGTGLFKRVAESVRACPSPENPEPASTRAQLLRWLQWPQREDITLLPPLHSLQRCGYLDYCNSWMKLCTEKVHLTIFAWLRTHNIRRTLRHTCMRLDKNLVIEPAPNCAVASCHSSCHKNWACSFSCIKTLLLW